MVWLAVSSSSVLAAEGAFWHASTFLCHSGYGLLPPKRAIVGISGLMETICLNRRKGDNPAMT